MVNFYHVSLCLNPEVFSTCNISTPIIILQDANFQVAHYRNLKFQERTVSTYSELVVLAEAAFTIIEMAFVASLGKYKAWKNFTQ